MDKIWTDEYKDPIHVVLQSLNPGFVMGFCFFPIKSPESIGTALEVTNHTRILARIIGIGDTPATLARIVKRQLFFYSYDGLGVCIP
jgi:hypothetical protein